jgi:hypothetical protein
VFVTCLVGGSIRDGVDLSVLRLSGV